DHLKAPDCGGGGDDIIERPDFCHRNRRVDGGYALTDAHPKILIRCSDHERSSEGRPLEDWQVNQKRRLVIQTRASDVTHNADNRNPSPLWQRRVKSAPDRILSRPDAFGRPRADNGNFGPIGAIVEQLASQHRYVGRGEIALSGRAIFCLWCLPHWRW